MSMKMTAEEFCRHVWQKYLVERRYDILEEVVDAQISVIGTGAHEMSPDLESFAASMLHESKEWNGTFMIKDQWYQTTELTGELSLVIGELAAKEDAEDGILYDVRFRFTMVLRQTVNGWKLIHVHQSVPDANQAHDEFFPHHMVETNSNQVIYNLRHDAMTGLLNRRYLKDIVMRSMESTAEGELLMIDIDNFKNLNDSYGHPFGDKVVVLFAQSLKASFPKAIIGRVGGDEFVVYVPQERNIEESAGELEKFLSDWEESQRPLGLASPITASVGIARFPQDGSNYEEVWKKADEALYRAKGNGKAQVYYLNT